MDRIADKKNIVKKVVNKENSSIFISLGVFIASVAIIKSRVGNFLVPQL
ncbi:uncharacterized protein SOCG_00764 [Schizosaccharomyces octosporus yFS286]|uniref:Uncharacterized protein n=1 Tax=Schizosaccharomyces octosporus (strain yFS286) TaxID=483514 RepID=S9PV79_SCHOY|nr:uncharacterized protein SOCG_00764 [Schizosaccharomyces octosporus yFS286]EPX73006.1 hypothetical protein SOCG_00764 [Schizosaccharomyces octosporus yFS286]